MSYPVTQLTTVTIPNGSLTAANYNAEFQNVYANVGKPENIDDYSENVSEMQTEADPGELGSESQATSLSAEIERIRFAIKEVKQKIDPTVAHWYQTPGTLNLGGVANTDTFTIYAQNDAFTETVLTLKTDTVSGTGYKFLECIVDVNGTPATKVTLDGQGNLVLGGTLTTTGLLTVNDIPGVKADKLILAEAGTGVNHITLQGPDSASTTTHVITLPGALPASQSFMLIDATGAVSYSLTPVIADQIGVQMTSVGADAIASTMTTTGANAIVADATIAPVALANSAIEVATSGVGANNILALSNLGDTAEVFAGGSAPVGETNVLSITLPTAGTYLILVHAGLWSGDWPARSDLYVGFGLKLKNGAGTILRNFDYPTHRAVAGVSPSSTINQAEAVRVVTYVKPYVAAASETVTLWVSRGGNIRLMLQYSCYLGYVRLY